MDNKKNRSSWAVGLLSLGFFMIMISPNEGWMPMMVTSGVCMILISVYLLKKK